MVLQILPIMSNGLEIIRILSNHRQFFMGKRVPIASSLNLPRNVYIKCVIKFMMSTNVVCFSQRQKITGNFENYGSYRTIVFAKRNIVNVMLIYTTKVI